MFDFLFQLRLFKALSQKSILVLWSGLALSAIGDEIYKVAMVWIAVKMVGAEAGYLAASQAFAILVFGLIGGVWADHWDPRRTMIRADLIRGLLVLVPVFWSIFFPLSVVLLLFVAVSVAALSAFFEPALQSVIPRLAPQRELMQATNGLMGTTSRLARAVGPGLIGALTAVIPTIHFFTLDALSFGASAYAVGKLKRELPPEIFLKTRVGIRVSLQSGFDSIRGDSLMKYVLYGKAVASGSWSVVLPLGIALLVESQLPNDFRAYGFLLAAYGAGNLAGALVLANISIQKPVRVMGWGFMVLGLGFFGLGLSNSLPWMMVWAAVAAVGGPMNDLAHIDIIQKRYSPEKLVRVVRLRMAIEFGGILLCLLIAPLLFKAVPVQWVIRLAASMIAAVGVVGLLFFA